MNQQNKEARVSCLIDEIGGIREEYLSEALSFHAPKRYRGPRIALFASAIAAVLTVAILSPFGKLFNRPLPVTSSPLDTALRECIESASFEECTDGSVDFYDGTVRIVVQEIATGALYQSRPLDAEEQNALQREMLSGAERVSESNDAYRVWILNGDGFVATSCLAPTVANLGIATLFDYNAERKPTEIFTNLLTDIARQE